MPNISDPLWAIHYPAGSVPLVPWQDHFLDQAESIAALFRLYHVPVRVDDEAMRDTVFPTPEAGDRVFRADKGEVTEIYDGSLWLAGAGGYLQAQRAASQTLTSGDMEDVIFTGATILTKGYLGGTFDSDTGIFTVDDDGQFEVQAQITIHDGGSAATRGSYIALNGTNVQGYGIKTDDLVTVPVGVIIDATAGDTIQMRAYQGSGANRGTYPTANYPTQLIVKRIG